MRVSGNAWRSEDDASSADVRGIDANEDVARQTATMKKKALLIKEDFSS
jgi:hypothetical protein